MKYSELMTTIEQFVQKEFQGNLTAAARFFEIKGATFTRWMNRERVPNAEDFSNMLAKIGVNFLMPNAQLSREVCFVDAKIVPAGEGLEKPEVEDYLAVPLLGEVGAGAGFIPQDELLSWFLVWKHQKAVQFKRNLIAVEISKNSDSMEPTLHPQDIVLVDRDEKNINHPGKIWLVKCPDGEAMVKRVYIEHLKDEKDYEITYMSDNKRHAPKVYSLRRDFHGDWGNAVVGRVLWAWSDVSNK